jgi:hypothetical protein
MKVSEMSPSEFDEFVSVVAAVEKTTGMANAARKTDNVWCTCPGDPHETGSVSYYAHDDGRHGWFHDPAAGGCGGVTQTG